MGGATVDMAWHGHHHKAGARAMSDAEESRRQAQQRRLLATSRAGCRWRTAVRAVTVAVLAAASAGLWHHSHRWQQHLEEDSSLAWVAASATEQPLLLNQRSQQIQLQALRRRQKQSLPPTVRAAAGDGRLNKDKLREEAGFAEGLVGAIGSFFNPEASEEAQQAKKAAERRAKQTRKLRKVVPTLRVAVPIRKESASAMPVRRPAPVSELQARAKQSLVFCVASRQEVLRDLFISLRLSGREFDQKNILVVPVYIDLKDRRLQKLPPELQKHKALTNGFVALPKPVDEEEAWEWGDLFASEYEEAEKQGMGESAKETGIVILIQQSGKLASRRIGLPVWIEVFDDLDVLD